MSVLSNKYEKLPDIFLVTHPLKKLWPNEARELIAGGFGSAGIFPMESRDQEEKNYKLLLPRRHKIIFTESWVGDWK